jgi:hypothetical protein
MPTECRALFIDRLINVAIDRRASARELASELVSECVHQHVLNKSDVS